MTERPNDGPASSDSSTSTESSLLHARYGTPDLGGLPTPEALTETQRVQLSHRSVRAFAEDPVSEETLATIVAAAQSAPTSSNLQTWSVVAIRDPERRARLAALAGEQAFIAQAPLFLVWLADLHRARGIVASQGRAAEGADFLESSLVAVIDAALAAQNAVVAAESLGLGTVYVGAVRNRPEDIAEELGLPAGTIAVVGLALGRPSPQSTARVKPRLPQSVVLHHETYDASVNAAEIDAYDRRVAAFYDAEGLRRRWVPAVVRRFADAAALHGRARLREAFGNRGLSLR